MKFKCANIFLEVIKYVMKLSSFCKNMFETQKVLFGRLIKHCHRFGNGNES